MEYPIDGSLFYNVYNVEPWTKQGTSYIIGGGFTTLSGQPSPQLQASTNLTIGYFNGQMLARSTGNGTGRYAGQIAGALINWDPSSTDTGQTHWNGWVICDPGLKFPLPLINPATNLPYIFLGTIQVATQLQEWVLRQQFLYGPGTPATDVAIVETAVTNPVGFFTNQSQCMNPSGSYETIFSY